MTAPLPSNQEIASVLGRISDLLETQGSDPFRVRAYRNAAQAVQEHAEPISDLVDVGHALEELPTIGKSIALTIRQFVHNGHARILDWLEDHALPEDQFTRIPGVGEVLAKEIHQQLAIDTMEELETAAHDGRLAQLKGMGPRRIQSIQNALAQWFRWRRRESTRPSVEPDVETLLSVDGEYRQRASKGELKLIAPRRFNPNNKRWLPVMHLDRDGWHFSVLFSNTARAHDLDQTKNWVVLFYERNGEHGQSTVVSERRGPMNGKRVVRGREEACHSFYREREKARSRKDRIIGLPQKGQTEIQTEEETPHLFPNQT